MKFTYNYPSTSFPNTIHVVTSEDKKEVKAIRFYGKVSLKWRDASGESRETVHGIIDNHFIDSFYEIAGGTTERPYATPKNSGEHSAKISCNKEQLHHSIVPDLRIEGQFLSILSNVPRDGEAPASEKASKSALYRTLLDFMQKNRKSISLMPEDRQEFRTLFGDQFVSAEEEDSVVKAANKVEQVKKIINHELDAYQKMGKKFGLFAKNADRNEVLTDLTIALKPITEKKVLEATDYEQIIKQLIVAKNMTLESHKNGSIFAAWGITSSRLAEGLERSIRQLVAKGIVSQELVDRIENPEKQIFRI